MKYERLVPLAVAAALYVLYLEFAVPFSQSGILQSATSIEQGVFVLQVGKIAVVASFRRLRDMRFVNVINLLGAEVVVALPTLAIAVVAYRDQGSSALLSQIFLGWVAGAATALTPYAVYRLARAMVQRESLVITLTSGVLLSEVVLLLRMGTDPASASGSGLTGLSRTIILLGGGTMTSGPQPSELFTLLPLTVIYVSLLLHSLSPHGGLKMQRFVIIAGLGVLTTALAFFGSYASSLLAIPFAYFVLVPALLASSLIWWRTREA